MRGTIPIAQISFPASPKFYELKTADGIPYSHIATLHGSDVLATTVLQNCIRYESRKKTCKFCAIGQSLAAGRTIAHKTPAQLAEVAAAAVRLDGVKHMVMTTGTPNATDRGASVLCDSARAIRAVRLVWIPRGVRRIRVRGPRLGRLVSSLRRRPPPPRGPLRPVPGLLQLSRLATC